jgi:hypothetical protein
MLANTRRPLRDRYYDHGRNCVKYIAVMFGPVAPSKERTKTEPDPYARLFYGPDQTFTWMARETA